MCATVEKELVDMTTSGVFFNVISYVFFSPSLVFNPAGLYF